MKHVLVNKDGMQHAVILGVPFNYTVPRNMDSFHDINHDFTKPYNYTGKLKVKTFSHTDPKPSEMIESDAIDFAIIKDGIIESVIVWGGAEWCPPFGTIITPLEKYIGKKDLYALENHKFTINPERMGKKDKDKTVEELEADFKNSELNRH